ncbi:MAG: hypothetical protein GEV03_23120 [Streptosporangiales bacterium]|nr:hypothetical protein [Streptosporangiales bacterium]
MTRSYRYYCRIAAVVFTAYTVYPVVDKLIEERLAHDWAHSALHLLSALFAAWAGWGTRSVLPAKVFVWAVGGLYLVLGVVGWFIPGLVLTTPFAIPLGPPENVFHLVLGVPAAIVAGLGVLRVPTARADEPRYQHSGMEG